MFSVRIITVLAAVAALVILQPRPAAAGEQEVIAEADSLYGQRSSNTRSNEAVELLRAGAVDYPDSYGIHWRLARATWWVCDGTNSESTKKSLGKEGWDAGARAMEIKSDGIEGRYWMVLALGEYSKGISILKAISQGLDGKFSDNLDWVLAQDEGYDQGGALRAKSRYHFSLPRFMRSFPKALEKLERSDALTANHPRTQYFLAVTHHALGDDEAARKALDASLNSTWSSRAERERVLGWAQDFEAELE